ncbi:MAG: AAA family ATPase [Synergistaceae bacterium]|nr:AAA family ATPase [Synergistaceae bacterium]
MTYIKTRTGNKLKTSELVRKTDPKNLGLANMGRIKPVKDLIGQDRAVESISFGLSVTARGYNIFVTGENGSGRTSYTLSRLRDIAKKCDTPDDWVYLYNFDEPGKPIAVNVPAGRGKLLCQALENLVNELKVTISKAFEKSQYEDAKAQLVKKFQEFVNDEMDDLKEEAAKKGFSLKRTPQGFVNIPLVADKNEAGEQIVRELEPEEYEALPSAKRKKFQNMSDKVSQSTLEILRKIRDREKELKEKISKLESDICRAAIEPPMKELREQHNNSEQLSKWFDRMTEDVIENFGVFVASVRDENTEIDFSRYSANLFISNAPKKGAPVIWETNPTYYNLVGKVEYESRQGYLYTDFKHIVAGAVHRANGGDLVLDAEKVLMNFMSWDALKRVLRTGESVIENLGEQYGAIPVASLSPSPVPIKIKIIMIGTPLLYELLQYYDPEFKKGFKINAGFDTDMPRSRNNEKLMARRIASLFKNESALPFTAEAVAEIINWTSREADDKNLMSTKLNSMCEMVVESAAWAEREGASEISAAHVVRAIDHKRYRSDIIEEKIAREFKNGVIRIDTEGKVAGQVNGLSVVDMMGHRFGHPSRITANVYMGQEGVVNIEREVKMTGPIHNKGIMILASFMGRVYAQDMPLSLTARITFEQNYGSVEGDSASSTELYCLLSALSEIPITQEIAVTGSVDQFGSVQPIGGVNEKIEGFFKYCKIKGLTGTQGVIIPKTNIPHLMLNSEVVEAVENGKFSVWAISKIDEGIEILMNTSARTVHRKVKARLKNWFEKAKKFGKDDKKTGARG